MTGENIDLLKMFLNLLSARGGFVENEPPIFQIDDTYSVAVSLIYLIFYLTYFQSSVFSHALECGNTSICSTDVGLQLEVEIERKAIATRQQFDLDSDAV